MKYIFAFILALGFFLPGKAQSTDSTTVPAKVPNSVYASPRKAAILSAIIPGAGQIYNRKIWKVPIIYAGLGGFGYGFSITNGWYNDSRRALRQADAGGGTADFQGQTYGVSDLLSLKATYQKQRDLCVIGMAAIYLLNIIDANIDAHLKTFDVSDNLTLQLKPNVLQTQSGFAPACTLTLKTIH